MKKVKSAIGRSAAKHKGAPKNVDEYLAGVPEARPRHFEQDARGDSLRRAREATETISMDARVQAQRSAGVVRAFSTTAVCSHCVVIEAFKNELKGFSTSKGTITSHGQPLPAALVKKMVKARVAQIESKKRR